MPEGQHRDRPLPSGFKEERRENPEFHHAPQNIKECRAQGAGANPPHRCGCSRSASIWEMLPFALDPCSQPLGKLVKKSGILSHFLIINLCSVCRGSEGAGARGVFGELSRADHLREQRGQRRRTRPGRRQGLSLEVSVMDSRTEALTRVGAAPLWGSSLTGFPKCVCVPSRPGDKGIWPLTAEGGRDFFSYPGSLSQLFPPFGWLLEGSGR